MNETISVLIAFVGFLIVFSMLAQAVQEGLKSIFKLKTGVWERFLLSLYKQEFRINVAEVKATSFWSRVRSGEFVGDFNTRLRRLKEVVVKTDELILAVKKALHDIETLSPDDPHFLNLLIPKAEVLAVTLKALTGLKIDSLLTTYNRFDSNTLSGVVDALCAFESTYPDLGYRVKALSREQIVELQKKCGELLNTIIAAEKKISDFRNQIENQIDAWIAQVNEEYRRNMLKWTIVTGLLLVVLFNADSFSIYKYLSSDPEAQAAVVHKALESAPKVLRTTAESLNGIDASLRAGDGVKAQKAMDEFSANLKDDFEMFGANDDAKTVADLRTRLQEIKPDGGDGDIGLLKEQEGELARMYAVLHKTAIDYQFQGIASLELPLGWTEDWRRFRSVGAWTKDMFLIILTKTGGLLITTFLITFGAPFWNDILSALFGLKNSLKSRRD